MENRTAPAVFTMRLLDTLRLLLTPAALAIENALLKDSYEHGGFEYHVGGSLMTDSESYVARRADRELCHGIRQRHFCYVLGPRQMGKSSLRVHTVDLLLREGFHCVSIDLTAIGSSHVSIEQWYAGVARALVAGMRLSQRFKLRTWWREHDHLSPVQRLVELFDKIVLEHTNDPIVVLIDEIDSILSLSFDLDDFFAMIRSLYDKRADDARYNRLTFVLLGVASPSELIQNKDRTPFNVGHGIHLDRFRTTEARVLLTGLVAKGNAMEILDTVLAWTNGQPFLTQKICHILSTLETSPRAGQESTWVGRAIVDHIVTNWEVNDEPVHFGTIQERIRCSPHRGPALLERYRHMLSSSGPLLATSSIVDRELLLSGLVVREGNKLHLGNRIYTMIFDSKWIDSMLTQIQQSTIRGTAAS